MTRTSLSKSQLDPSASPAPQPLVVEEQEPSSGTLARLLRNTLARTRGDSLLRSSSLLVIDYLIIGAIGGICSVIWARSWSAYDVGTVAAITGVVTLVSTATSNGLASTITRFLATESNQLDFILEAMIVTVVAGGGVSAAVCFVPGHFGVPLHDLPTGTGFAFLLVAGYVITNNMTTITDPAFISRKEVSYAVAKDLAASALRIVILILFIGTNALGLFGASVLYTAIAGVMDLGLIAWRLRNAGPTRTPILRFSHLRPRIRFTLSSHGAALVSTLPSSLFITIAAAFDGPTVAAEVGIPLTVAGYISIIPSMTSQALLAELSDPERKAGPVAVRALRMCYAGALPAAVLIGICAPWILLIFGHRYSVHSAGYLRWGAGATLLGTCNYVSDTVLLAREKIMAYNLVNVLGAAAVLGCVFAAGALGRQWFGPAVLVGQLAYLSFSLIAILRYTTLAEVAQAVGTVRARA